MAELYMEKALWGLRPADIEAEEYLSKIKLGDMLRVKVTKPRNPMFHRMAFSLLQLVYNNQEKYNNFNHFLTAMKVAAGHYDEVITLDGEVILSPKSVSFQACDELEFRKLFDRWLEIAVRDFLPGVDSAELERQVLDYAGNWSA